MNIAPADLLVVGDPQPIPRTHPHRLCTARTTDGLRCSRLRDHVGRQHVAGDGTTVLAVWAWHEDMTFMGDIVLSVVAIDLNIELDPAEPGRCSAIRGDRAMLRSSAPNFSEDVFAVLERGHGALGWRPVTEALTKTQIREWHLHRTRKPVSMSRAFDQWLNHVAARHRMDIP
ncbi:hypothetical protein MOQ72_34170 [Saccharopolyspora sp. K220]|uniref:hypothetical protein n=1 Tax=Saccharopolyspora soli TaxID=2926618 RepID=UPI001F57695F|nr:hypothetical protein [Saccharopolyspora soli]MCI2422486.1 hypothetical protein [Saccharopolyspora soli]